jgi:small nuclear ribonucleoprotein (snRNP)-like protein
MSGKSTKSKDTQESSLGFLQDLCSQQLQVKLTDERIITGVLNCIDRDMNLLLSNSYERSGQNTRYVGLVMVPGEHAVSVIVL